MLIEAKRWPINDMSASPKTQGNIGHQDYFFRTKYHGSVAELAAELLTLGPRSTERGTPTQDCPAHDYRLHLQTD